MFIIKAVVHRYISSVNNSEREGWGPAVRPNRSMLFYGINFRGRQGPKLTFANGPIQIFRGINFRDRRKFWLRNVDFASDLKSTIFRV